MHRRILGVLIRLDLPLMVWMDWGRSVLASLSALEILRLPHSDTFEDRGSFCALVKRQGPVELGGFISCYAPFVHQMTDR